MASAYVEREPLRGSLHEKKSLRSGRIFADEINNSNTFNYYFAENQPIRKQLLGLEPPLWQAVTSEISDKTKHYRSKLENTANTSLENNQIVRQKMTVRSKKNVVECTCVFKINKLPN
jgi:hypothetical protein